jgi:antitoxin component YwqK of YwqJK toxin-antitoxin module
LVADWFAGKLHGQVAHYLPDGQLAELSEWFMDIPIGKHQLWAAGQLQLELTYADGELVANSAGITMPFESGTLDVKWPNGQTALLGRLDVGKWDGPRLRYYQNGKLQESANFVGGKLHGEYRLYYPSGQPLLFCTFRNGVPDGQALYYNAEGEQQQLETYHAGWQHGKTVWGNPAKNAFINFEYWMNIPYSEAQP